jgi:hypothetical protein
MPYCVGEGMPEWDEYMERDDGGKPPVSLFTYIDPWEAKTTVLPFPETPGPEPELPEEASAHALWRVSRLTAPCRALRVRRVFGAYDGGGDESFTYFRGVEMSDGRVITAESLREEVRGIDREQLVENAAAALMGSFDVGEFVLHGVLIIDFDACTITDEKNPDIVFGDKMPWEA